MLPVTIAGVTKSYDGTTPVLDGIDLRIADGELFFLLGGSGCGKTTLLRTVAGFLAPDRGSVRFGDRDVTAVPTEQRDIGMVFQNYALWPHLTVSENVAFGLDVRKAAAAEKARRVAEALELVALADLGPRRIGELSGGQQQRVALARALVIRPKVLLLDEPLSNLDARLRQSMRTEIRRLCKASGVTALYVTHDQAEALSTADRIALMARGRIAQLGTPRELYDRPATEAVARFLGDANILARADVARLGVEPAPGERFCLRPERVRLGATGAAAAIVEGSFLGDRAQWLVDCGGLRLTVSEAMPPERRAGDAVRLAVAAGDLVPLAG
jgi:ABC-type Fe3+/spermidine/putrescine transport system ATPase subunit